MIVSLFLITSAIAQTEYIRCGGKIIRVYNATAEDVLRHCGEPDKRSEIKTWGRRIESARPADTKPKQKGVYTPPDTAVHVYFKQWWTYSKGARDTILRFEGFIGKSAYMEELKRKGKIPLRWFQLQAIEHD